MSRYIDAENILYSSVMIEEDNGNYRKMWIATKEDIDAIPTADVRENVRGEWIITKTERGWNCAEYPTEVTCSNCNYIEDYQKALDFCPNCGADMRGEVKHEI